MQDRDMVIYLLTKIYRGHVTPNSEHAPLGLIHHMQASTHHNQSAQQI